MKLPRGITGWDLIKKLRIYEYEVVRQTGSHIRIATPLKGGHYETIPNHSPLKIGTLNAILNNIATHFQISKEELVMILFD